LQEKIGGEKAKQKTEIDEWGEKELVGAGFFSILV
jgi:hypothetical protein